ncbi:MAG: energy transducer TonB [Parafilimonas sp.]
MKYLLAACFLLLTVCLRAQDTNFTDTRKPFIEHDTVYVEAGFPGGVSEWMKYLERRLHPETAANHKAPPGVYVVTAAFTIDTTGKVVDIKLFKDPGYGTGEDVIHVLTYSPAWWPATINGKPVIYRHKQNFTYTVTEE